MNIVKAKEPVVNLDVRAKINELEKGLLSVEQVEIVPTHYFCSGLYAREIFIPAGTVLTGKIHRYEHLNFITKGKIAVVTEVGTQIIEAPATIVSQPGTKRVGYALEDTIWTTVHASNETDVDKLEQELVTDSHEYLGEVQ